MMALLEQATSIEDIITIESRLSEVRYQIESMESQLRTFDNQVDYSTVSISISEVKELTPVVEESAGTRIRNGFVNSLNNDANNQMIVCPNHHSVIHAANPVFDRRRMVYRFDNGAEERIILNKHLV